MQQCFLRKTLAKRQKGQTKKNTHFLHSWKHGLKNKNSELKPLTWTKEGFFKNNNNKKQTQEKKKIRQERKKHLRLKEGRFEEGIWK